MQKKLTALLHKIEKQNEEELAWIVGPKTGRMLYYLVRIWRPKLLLEIGTSIGYSAIWMATAMEENDFGQIVTIESHTRRFGLAEKNIAKAGLEHRIRQVKGHAPEVITEGLLLLETEKGRPSARLDMAFFDATKQETQSFFDTVFPLMNKGGLVIVDNVKSHRFKSMLEFIDGIHKDPRLEVVEIDVGAGLLLAVKK